MSKPNHKHQQYNKVKSFLNNITDTVVPGPVKGSDECGQLIFKQNTSQPSDVHTKGFKGS